MSTKSPTKEPTKKTAKRSAKNPAKKSVIKTRPTAVSVDAFIEAVPNETRKKDAKTLLALMKKVTGEKPTMWGPSIIGFGSYHYKYESGREGDMCATGFSPRGSSLVLYILPGVAGYEPLLKKLGKHRHSVSCLYINKLADVDMKVLETLIADGWAHMRKKYPA